MVFPHLPDSPITALDAEEWSALGGSPLAIVDLQERDAQSVARRLTHQTQAIVLGVDRVGECPSIDEEAFDCLLTSRQSAVRPWVSIAAERIDKALETLQRMVDAAPVAGSVLIRVLRINARLDLRDALDVESLAFSTLLAGSAFAQWRDRQARTDPASQPQGPLVSYARNADQVTLTLTHQASRKAMSAAMRDALFEALAAVCDDPSRPGLILRGEGRCFSVGGELAEFGTATDLAMAHAIRTARSCVRLLADLEDRAEVFLHGACIGSGLEIPAAAARRIAAPRTLFQLPELSMGLIPGAGGTVSVPRAIGRHRTAWMVLSGQRISAATALEWGLVHEISKQ